MQNVPGIVAHRGLLRHAPENTLPALAACLELGLGFEIDVRRTRDGKLVCLHDATLDRTTDGKGKLADHTWEEIRKLDAGGWFDPAFRGARIPSLDEVFALLKERGSRATLVALDLKDPDVEEDVVRAAVRFGVLDRVVGIGRTIEQTEVRRRLKKAEARMPVAVLAQRVADLPAALEEKNADWIYVRFLPTRAQVERLHGLGKKVFLVGPLVAGNAPDNWRAGRDAGVDAVLTDFPLDCRRAWREGGMKDEDEANGFNGGRFREECGEE